MYSCFRTKLWFPKPMLSNLKQPLSVVFPPYHFYSTHIHDNNHKSQLPTSLLHESRFGQELEYRAFINIRLDLILVVYSWTLIMVHRWFENEMREFTMCQISNLNSWDCVFIVGKATTGQTSCIHPFSASMYTRKYLFKNTRSNLCIFLK